MPLQTQERFREGLRCGAPSKTCGEAQCLLQELGEDLGMVRHRVHDHHAANRQVPVEAGTKRGKLENQAKLREESW
jgi:hypothetical protein